MSFIQWWCERRAKSHVAKEISRRGRRKSRDEKGNQGVGDFRFINILQISSIYYYYFCYHLFSILFLPTTFTHTHTHDPRPLPTTHDPRHLATLVKISRAISVTGSFSCSRFPTLILVKFCLVLWVVFECFDWPPAQVVCIDLSPLFSQLTLCICTSFNSIMLRYNK